MADPYASCEGTKAPLSQPEKRFMDCLEFFMEQCYIVIENQRRVKLAQMRMSDEERIAKIKQLTELIQEKEKELQELEAERSALNSVNEGTPQVLQKMSAQNTPAAGFRCVENCPAKCPSKQNTSLKVGPCSKASSYHRRNP